MSRSRACAAGSVNGRAALRCSSSGRCTPGPRRCTTRWSRGSGTGELAGIVGTLHLDIEEDGTHRYELTYDL
ncbi:MAG: DUF3224 domain-containing protein [Nocardioidaceae bacterium]